MPALQTRKTRLKKKRAYAAAFRADHLSAVRAQVRTAAASLRARRLAARQCLDCGCRLTASDGPFTRCQKDRTSRAKKQAAYRAALSAA